MQSMYQSALYYPYIHIRDADWLKRTLLLFPHVARMVPSSVIPGDSKEIERLAYNWDEHGPLLRHANLYDSPVIEALQRLKVHISGLLAQGSAIQKFGREATEAEKTQSGDQFGFQFHPAKASPHFSRAIAFAVRF